MRNLSASLLLLTVGFVLNVYAQDGAPPPASRTKITVQEPKGGWQVPQFGELTITGNVTGETPADAIVSFRAQGETLWTKEYVELHEGRFSHAFRDVAAPIEFWVGAGDARTETFKVAVIPRLHVTRVTAHYQYPAYTGLPEKDAVGGRVEGVEGTRVRLVFESSMPLKQAVLVLEPGGDKVEREALPLTSKTTFEKTFTLTGSAGYHIELHGEDGSREAKVQRGWIVALPDQPPQVELLSPAAGLAVTRRALVPVRLRVRDDFGLTGVQVLYRVNDGEPRVLGEQVTGVIPQKGATVAAEFAWDLSKVQLPETGALSLSVRAKDNCPFVGRAPAESAPAEIKLTRPGQLHADAVERATKVVTEARIAYGEQRAAREAALDWGKNGTGKEDDKLWLAMEEKQQNAARAAKAVKSHLDALAAVYEPNRMESEFMAVRLAVVAGLVKELVEKRLPAIQDRLRAARPKTETDTVPDKLKQARTAAVAAVSDDQKTVILACARVFGKLFSWRDLQGMVMTTRQLSGQQEAVSKETADLARRTTGINSTDIPEWLPKALAALSKKQRDILDVEQNLEGDIARAIQAGEKRGHDEAKLKAALTALRQDKFEEHVERAAKFIENNQCISAGEDQKQALSILKKVEESIILGGQEVEKDPPLNTVESE